MSINYYGDTKTFVLENSRFTYAMGIDDDGVLVNIYFGKRISDGKNLKIKHRTIKNWIGKLGVQLRIYARVSRERRTYL